LAARLTAFQQLVQVARTGDQDGVKKANDNLNLTIKQLKADGAALRQDVQPLEKKIRQLMSKEGAAPEHRQENAPRKPAPAPGD
jgi:cell division protein FtsB